MKPVKFLISFYRSLILLLLIFFASTIPAEEVPQVTWLFIPYFDKLIHLGMYFSFSFVLIFDLFKAKPAYSYSKIYLISALIAIIYGASLEIFQAILTQSRSGDMLDLAFNSLGVLFALLLWIVIKKSK